MERRSDERSHGSNDRRHDSNERRRESSERRFDSRDKSSERRFTTRDNRSRSRSPRDRFYKSNQPISRAERDINKMEQLKKMGIDIGCGVSLHKHPNMNNGAGSGPLLHSNGYGTTVGITGPGMTQYTRPAPLLAHPPVAANPAAAAIAAAAAAAAALAANVVSTTTTTSNGGDSINMANFTAPILISPRYTEQMQKRKLLWSGKKSVATSSATSDAEKITVPVSTTNKWEQTKFSQDTDGKVASKFLRLMGIKDAPKAVADADGQSDVIQQQNEMFTTMQHQYDVARQVTHTMRGMGLGFGSQRQF